MAQYAPPLPAREAKRPPAADPARSRAAAPAYSRRIPVAIAAEARRAADRPIQARAAPDQRESSPLERAAQGVAGLFRPKPREPNRTGLPDRLKTGVEALSGLAMDDVRVHRNSAEPARLGALAYTQGRDIHLAPGQEEHLPHEAWHVVQQKQGRVRGTAQFKGVTVNADHGLEAEADLLGSRAAANSSRFERTPLSKSDYRGAVVQAKILFGENELAIPASGASAAMKSYIDSSVIYLIRDDWHPDKKGKYGNEKSGPLFKGIGFFDTYFHLLKKLGRYLIGELHEKDEDIKKTSRWWQEIRPWSKANKMREKFSTFLSEDTDKIYTEKEDPQSLSLESVHVRMLSDTLMIHRHMNAICSKELRSAWIADEEQLSLVTDLIYPEFRNVTLHGVDYKDYYKRAKIYKAGGGILTARQSKIYKFSEDFDKSYSVSLSNLEKLVRGLSKESETKSASSTISKSSLKTEKPKTLTEKLNAADTARDFLPIMLNALIEINDINDQKEASTLYRLSKISPKWEAKEGLLSTVEARERAMVTQISNAPTPLLVQVGNGHVLSLKGKVSDAVPVPLGESLENIAKEPKSKDL